MAKRQPPKDQSSTALDKARDELYSLILRCGVLQAQEDHQKEWFDDTMEYMAERYPTLAEPELEELRQLGERYCQPVIPHTDTTVGATH
jgi:hypothetical protein